MTHSVIIWSGRWHDRGTTVFTGTGEDALASYRRHAAEIRTGYVQLLDGEGRALETRWASPNVTSQGRSCLGCPRGAPVDRVYLGHGDFREDVECYCEEVGELPFAPVADRVTAA